MIQKTRLFTPGPTPLSPAVQEALGRPILHHRTDEFRAILRECLAGLQRFLKTDDEVLILSSSGTGAMEAALVNVLSPQDPMLALVAGNFGERWASIGRAHGMDVRTLEAPWGEAVSAASVEASLRGDPSIRAVFVQLSESSTGARHDIEALGKVTGRLPGTLLVVDAISGAGALPLETGAWGVDVAIVGSQKSLALPPGLAFLSVSAKAWKAVEASRTPRFYFDLQRERRAQGSGEVAFTPPIAHILALNAALQALEAAGGVDALVDNAATLAAMTRSCAAALGMRLVAPRDHGDALTALYPPAGVEAAALVKALKKEFGSTVASGQGRLKGQILRIAHLGHYDATDLLGLLGTLEIVLAQMGCPVEAGTGAAAAQAEYRRRRPRL